MPAVSLNAHFDGQHIQLDEPFELPRNAQLLVTVLKPSLLDEQRAARLLTFADEFLPGVRGIRDDQADHVL